ncbi:MAG: valine--tRNA ligase [Candidatus Woesearchaeota archaeon]
MEQPQTYDATIEEKKCLQLWQQHKVYKTDTSKPTQPVFAIDTPPPTMSGRMHIGHSFSYAQQDCIARFKRLQGYHIFFPFGTDDNGLPTEKLVQKEKKVVSTRMDRQAFIALCNTYLEEQRPQFVQDWKDLGVSCDFDMPYSTINDHCRKIAQQSFLSLAKKKLVYRKQSPVIWDTVFQTAIAQAELEDIQKETWFNDIVFEGPQKEQLIIATTRPELLGACVCLFVHPQDTRYTHLVGKQAKSPLYQHSVPILTDEKVDPQKGTGMVMCCTFGDQTDIEWYKKHQLPLKMIITKDGKMNDLAGPYANQNISEARQHIIDDLKEAGLLVHQQKITHTVNVGERSGVPVEIIDSPQWYVQYTDKKEAFLQQSAQLQWFPPHMKHRLDNWIKGLHWDWSIARQRSFGIPIPVWYDAQGNIYYADESQLPVDPLKERPLGVADDIALTPETDVFDTWFTSASTPFIARELLKGTPLYDAVFPMSLRPQAHDIISFWLFYTMAKTQLLHEQLPWKDVIVSGWVLDPHGKKMSKSKGNIIAPQVYMQKYSADALRYAACIVKLGDDTPFQEKDVQTGQKIVMKLWNVSKFVNLQMQTYDGKKPEELQAFDSWMLHELYSLIPQVTQCYEQYEVYKARTLLDTFFWNVLCDNYIEIVKGRLYNDEQKKKSAQYALTTCFEALCVMYAPIMPFVTEAVYQYVLRPVLQKESISIHQQSWPTAKACIVPEHAHIALQTVTDIRRYKASQQVSLKTPVKILYTTLDLREWQQDITNALQVQDIKQVQTLPDDCQKVNEHIGFVLGEAQKK